MDLPDLDEDERWSFSLAVSQSGPGAILIVLADAEYASNHATGPGTIQRKFFWHGQTLTGLATTKRECAIWWAIIQCHLPHTV